MPYAPPSPAHNHDSNFLRIWNELQFDNLGISELAIAKKFDLDGATFVS